MGYIYMIATSRKLDNKSRCCLRPDANYSQWCWSFPRGREISLAREKPIPRHGQELISASVRFKQSSAAQSQLPATLFVSRESREETLLHYCLILNCDLPRNLRTFRKKTPRYQAPFCFNPALDTAWLTIEPLIEDNLRPWWDFLHKKHPTMIASIKELELRNFKGRWPEKPGRGTVLSFGSSFAESFYKQLARFRGLEKITVFRYDDDFLPLRLLVPSSEEDTHRWMAEFVEEYQDCFEGKGPVCEFVVESEWKRAGIAVDSQL